MSTRAPNRDGRKVYINGERVDDLVTYPAFVDVRARIARILAFARYLLNSDYIVRKAAALSDRIIGHREAETVSARARS